MFKSEKILNQIKDLQRELELHQSKCKHKKVQKTPKADTGNFNPYDDHYYYTCYCTTCQKRWIEDQ